MDDDTTKEENQPSTSKKDTQRTTSGNDLYDDRRGRDERASNSETSVSATYSVRSRIDMADARPEVPKPPLGKREPKIPDRKKRGRRVAGRVEKRLQRSFTRRVVRRAPKRRPRPRDDRKGRDVSVSTIFTRLSSRSGSRTPGCIHCGHRCCRRRAKRFVVRLEYQIRRLKARRNPARRGPKFRRKKIERVKRKKPVIKYVAPKYPERVRTPPYPPPPLPGSKQIQSGSRSVMFSPLFINTNSTPEEASSFPPQTFCHVTPEMIHEALRHLCSWKQEVHTTPIMEYLKRNYPVNPKEVPLMAELKEKLRVAAIVGIVIQTTQDYWSLTSALQKRKLGPNHVTLFWQAYADTLGPVTKKSGEVNRQEELDKQAGASPRRVEPTGFSDDVI